MVANRQLIEIETPRVPAKWDVDKSVEKTKREIFKWKRLTASVANELWIAREVLSHHGGDRRSDQRNKSSIETWSDYCEAIDSSRQVVNRWLQAFFPKLNSHDDKSRKTPKLSVQTFDVRQGDFTEVLADVVDANLVLTDPPYGREFLPCWGALGKWAANALADDGVLVAYSGQMYLTDVLSLMSEHLDYWWCGAVIHAGSGNLTPLGHPVRKVINKWKPLVMFVRKGGQGYQDTFEDLLQGAGSQKDHHNWQQHESEAAAIVEAFTSVGDLVVDPFAGSGGFCRVANDLGRSAIGAEILKAE